MKNILWGLILGVVLTVFFVFPLFPTFATHLSSRQDGVLIAWLIDWGSYALLNQENFFTAPFFYPYSNTTAYSDLFFPTALLNIPLTVMENYLVAHKISFFSDISSLSFVIINHNVHLVLGTVAVFWAQYLLGLHLFKSKLISLFSAIVFTFSNFHLDYMAHLHVYLVAGIPLFFLALFKFVQTRSSRHLWLLSLSFLYQVLNSPMSGYFLIILSGITLVHKQVRQTILKEIHRLIPYFVGTAILLIFFFRPYIAVSNQFDYTRSIRDTAHFAFSLNKFIHVEIIFYCILIFILLISNKKYIKTKLTRKTIFSLFNSNSYFVLFLLITLVGGTLLLGPVLKINDQTVKFFGLPIPLPYGVLYYLLPGFKAFRASSRWIVIFIFGLSLVIGYLIKVLPYENTQHRKKQLLLLIMVTTAVLWITQVPFIKKYPVNTEVPPIYEIVKERPEKVLAEFPTYVWSQTDTYYREADRLLYQSFHQKKMYNGFSGFAPPEREYLWHTISDTLTDETTIKHLKESKVELVLLHSDEKSTYQHFTSPDYQLIACQNQDCLYKLR